MRADRDIVLNALATAKPSRNGWFRANCPMCPSVAHKQDTKRSFGIHPSTGAYRCWRCGTHGKLEEMTLNEAQAAALTTMEEQAQEPSDLGQPEGFTLLADGPGRTAVVFTAARQYLGRRGFTARTVRAASIGATLAGRYAGRIIIPVLEDDVWFGFVARSWVECDRPYLYPGGMPRGELLYNRKALDVETEMPVGVTEGAFDALALAPHGVAVFGKPTDEQREMLRYAKRPVSWVLDGDAWEEGWAEAMLLRGWGVRAGAVRLPPQTDPDQVPYLLVADAMQASIEAPGGYVTV